MVWENSGGCWEGEGKESEMGGEGERGWGFAFFLILSPPPPRFFLFAQSVRLLSRPRPVSPSSILFGSGGGYLCAFFAGGVENGKWQSCDGKMGKGTKEGGEGTKGQKGTGTGVGLKGGKGMGKRKRENMGGEGERERGERRGNIYSIHPPNLFSPSPPPPSLLFVATLSPLSPVLCVSCAQLY